MGAVYLAKDVKDQGRLCAIKEMSLSMVSREDQPRAIQNFKVEAKILWGLDHPNLPSLTGFFSQNERYFLVMEYIEGYTLEDRLERGGVAFPERRVLGWARQLCDVLTYLHSQKPPIIFRDMKPGNVMLTRQGQIKLIDFGIARFFRSSLDPDTQILGTPGYAPPEQYGKSQTDERSDIYALGMTLFHLLTNTLSEHGFGLDHVHERFPRISPMVARALEKATRIDPDERYENVEAFRRALLSVSPFVFESGEIASTPEELADLCLNYPEEASEYLRDEEIEAWLHDLGEEEYAKVAHQLSQQKESDPVDALEELVHIILGKIPQSHMYIGDTGTSIVASQTRHTSPTMSSAMTSTAVDAISTPAASVRNPHTTTISASQRQRVTPPRSVPVQVRPGVLDFGTMYPGISAPLTISIGGSQGYAVHGTIHTNDQWLQLSQRQFDGAITDIGVRVNSLKLKANEHYSGKIVITPADEHQHDIVVAVEVDVQEYTLRNRRHPGKTNGADLDAYDDDDDFDAVIQVNGSQQVRSSPALQVASVAQDMLDDDDDVDDKYATYSIIGNHNQIEKHWDPAPLSATQAKWRQRVLTAISAFMVSSLVYIWLSALRQPPLPPNPTFILLLVGMIPAATFGALIMQRSQGWKSRESINRSLTSLMLGLLSTTVVEGLWQLLIHTSVPTFQLFVLLCVVSLSATIGMQVTPSNWILSLFMKMESLLSTMFWLFVSLAAIIGGGLGYFLTMGFALNYFTPLAILLGMAVIVVLVLWVDYLVHINSRTV